MSFNIGELFIKLGIKGDTKELDTTAKKLEKVKKIQEKSNESQKKQYNETKKANEATVKSVKALTNTVKGLSGGIKGVAGALEGAGGVVGAVGAVVGAVTVAYMAIDKMITSLSQANQQMISFQRQTGISFASLNKYASANAAVNFNSSIEGTAQSMQRLANNLWDIQMGRGDISPYQELAFVGGKSFNPYGKSVEEVIESVREAIKGVDDIQATNIITRMGFSPDDLLMLRMSREEFEQINNLFLDPKSREALNKYSLAFNKAKISMNTSFQKLQIQLLKEYGKSILDIVNLIDKLTVAYTNFRQWLSGDNALGNLLKLQFAPLRTLYLLIDDIATYFAGGNSVLGETLNGIAQFAKGVGEALENSKLGAFFKAIEEGISKLASLKLPSWLVSFFDFMGKYMPFSGVGMVSNALGLGVAPTNPNNVSYGGNNMNTTNYFSIATEQPMGTVINDIMNEYSPTQILFANGYRT